MKWQEGEGNKIGEGNKRGELMSGSTISRSSLRGPSFSPYFLIPLSLPLSLLSSVSFPLFILSFDEE